MKRSCMRSPPPVQCVPRQSQITISVPKGPFGMGSTPAGHLWRPLLPHPPPPPCPFSLSHFIHPLSSRGTPHPVHVWVPAAQVPLPTLSRASPGFAIALQQELGDVGWFSPPTTRSSFEMGMSDTNPLQPELGPGTSCAICFGMKGGRGREGHEGCYSPVRAWMCCAMWEMQPHSCSCLF